MGQAFPKSIEERKHKSHLMFYLLQEYLDETTDDEAEGGGGAAPLHFSHRHCDIVGY
jgi:hypothetical protein